MPVGSEQRRLAAILVADVVGFSRMMARDESGTLRRLKKLRTDLIDPTVAQHNGRLVKLIGDGALVEFNSVSAAVECALRVQEELVARNATVPADSRIHLRIGINLGEVIVDGDDIYGDGVNVAARLEATAEPGGVAISGAAYDQAKGALSADFDFVGEHQMKNIPAAVRVYRVSRGRERASHSALERGQKLSWLRPAVLLPAILIAGIAGGSAWWLGSPLKEPTSAERLIPTRIVEKPSIVVLPFDNLSADPQQSYFSDGMTESVITDLSRVGELLVIAWNTSSTFKDQTVDIQAVARELGVRYVVEGSVQRAGDSVRINVQLIDADSGRHLWAEKLDRQAAEVFALQDEVAREILDALEVQLTQEQRRAVAKTYTEDLQAYDLYLRAWDNYWQFNDQSRRQARSLLREALAVDPGFARAHALLAATYTNQVGASLRQSDASLDQAYAIARRAVALDEDVPQVHMVLGLVHMFRREYEAAVSSVERAIELDPNYADAYALLCWILQYSGEPERGLEAMKTAIRLNPRAPFPYLNAKAEAYFSLGQYDLAVLNSEVALQRNPAAQRVRMFMAAALAHMGRIEEASWEIEELLLLEPDFTIDAVPSVAPYEEQATIDRLIEGLRQAGLPG